MKVSTQVNDFPSLRKVLDISAYLVIGPENTNGRDVATIVKEALAGGITCVQLRAKHSDASEIIALARQIAEVIEAAGKSDSVAFVIDDRVDVAWECRCMGIKVDGVHVGQTDMDVHYCRQLLGDNAIIGLSAATDKLVDLVNELDEGVIDYVGAGPVHPSVSKPDCGVGDDGQMHVLAVQGISRLADISRYPVVAGGGVSVADVPELARTKAAGWFVISAIAGADDPQKATEALVKAWRSVRDSQ
ncbi:thiamine phosphate synthase [Bifidobacterium aquikefiricola]|uniref:Thiamine-phosphate synthase n=1 Tax=Bifidobacterium aquikefiricola TaxID=3059038 RepID=A0AB39U4T5_9BIFI